jgi:Ca2+-binding EF-hand superfamily protein
MEREAAVKEATRIFQAVDTDQNGSISFAEWCSAGVSMQSKQSMKQAFGAAVSKKVLS